MNDPNNELGKFPDGLRAAIKSALDSGERIVWVGRPHPRHYVVQTIPLLLFAVPFTLIPAMMIAPDVGLHIPGVSLGENQSGWFAVPFLIIGVGLLATPFWAVRIARRTGYVLTDRRAIIFDGVRPWTIYTFLHDRLRNLNRTERRDGSGNLIFLKSVEQNSPGNPEPTERGFMAIPNVKQVEELVRRLVEEHGHADPAMPKGP
jgi:hypothetical protein